MKTVLDELKEWMESTEFYPSHFSVINKIKELKSKEKEQIIKAYEDGIWEVGCRTADSDKYFNDTYINID